MSNNLTLNIEEIKKEKDGLDVLADIYIHAVIGEKLSPKDLLRLQWYGIYASDDSQKFFELRIPLNMGEINLSQLKTLTTISKEYANDSLSFLDEQKIEFKNIKLHNLPEILNLLKEVNLTTFFESGHTVRRIITCPLNGIDSEQLYDVSSIVEKLDDTFIGNKRYSNLPNKLQIAISGYEEGCALNYIPDVSFNASKDEKNKIIFKIRLQDKNIGYIYPSQVVNTAKGIAKIYRDFGERGKKSSFEEFIKNLGLKKFFDILETSLPFVIKPIYINFDSPQNRKPRMGINESKVNGESYIGCVLKDKIQKADTIEKFTFLLEKYEASKIKITHKGNIIILDAPTSNAKTFAKELEKINFNPFI